MLISKSVLTAEGELFSGTVADFQGTTPLIFRSPLKTDNTDVRQLNAPHFIHSFRHSQHVYLFFRETAIEYQNCGSRIYSRVARVCVNDQGELFSRFVVNIVKNWMISCSNFEKT